MFTSPLYVKPPVPSLEEINIGLEKCFSDLDFGLKLVDRLSLAREAFVSVPDEHVTTNVTNLFTANFADVPAQFVPEQTSVSLENAYKSSSKEMKTFALESADGVIGRIVEFVKKIIAKVRGFIKGLMNSAKSTYTFKFSFGSVLNATIKPTEDFAVFSKGGEVTIENINKVVNESSRVAQELLNTCIRLHQAATSFNYSPKEIERSIGIDKRLDLIPETDWPGIAFFTVNEHLEPSITLIGDGEKPTKMASFEVSKVSVLSSYGKSTESTREHLLKSVNELDKALAVMEKEADSITKARHVSSASSDGYDTVTDVEVKQEKERSPQAMRVFVKIIAELTRGISGVSLKFMAHQAKAMQSLAQQTNPKLSQ